MQYLKSYQKKKYKFLHLLPQYIYIYIYILVLKKKMEKQQKHAR
jgi:hypothetical protein